MKKRFFQSLCLRLIYTVFLRWFLKIVVGVRFDDCAFLKQEKQFILLANHNSHLDTISLLASLPGKIIWKVKPVAAEDYFGNTKSKAAFSNYFINTLLIKRKSTKEERDHPIKKMVDALDAGYSLLLFPEGTRGTPERPGEMKSGIGRILSLRPHIRYVPVYLNGMGRSLPKGELLLLPYNSSVNYGKPTLAGGSGPEEIMQQITADFEAMRLKYQSKVSTEED
jgi:1-acyl-sn-glycerol-3-phosphate acyltransferase